MKTIGLLGGMSWESTASYYSAINEGIGEAFGGLHSAKIALYSVDFEEIADFQNSGDWAAAGRVLIPAARSIESMGADVLLLCTNTMHKIAGEIESAISIPLLHIADATATRLERDGVRRVGLVGTRFTMEESFYRDRITKRHDIDILIPPSGDRLKINNIIYQELCLGTIRQESRERYLNTFYSLRERGAEAIILGCTEISLLVQQEHCTIPLYDTAAIHATRAVEYALSE